MSFIPTSTPPHHGLATGPRAGFWRRFGADCVDTIILVILYLILSAILNTTGDVLAALVGISYFTYLEGGIRGQTFGKSAMNIRVITIDDNQPIGYRRALIRSLGRILSAFPIYLGYLWMLWDPERQTWHDKLAHSVVVPVAAYPLHR